MELSTVATLTAEDAGMGCVPKLRLSERSYAA